MYRVRLPGGKLAFVVTTAGTFGNGLPFGEAFILSPGGASTFRAKRFAVAKPDSQVAVDFTRLVDPVAAAKEWAVGELEGDLLEWHEEHPDTDYPEPPALQQLAGQPLVQLWVSGIAPNELKRVRDATRSVELRTYLDKVVQLTPLEHLDLAKHPQTVPGQAPGAR